MMPTRCSTRGRRRRVWDGGRAGGSCAPADPTRTRWRVLLLRFPEDPVDLFDEVEQALTLRRVLRLLRVAGGFGGPPEEVVELRVRLEVLGLEVVGPQHP